MINENTVLTEEEVSLVDELKNNINISQERVYNVYDLECTCYLVKGSDGNKHTFAIKENSIEEDHVNSYKSALKNIPAIKKEDINPLVTDQIEKMQKEYYREALAEGTILFNHAVDDTLLSKVSSTTQNFVINKQINELKELPNHQLNKIYKNKEAELAPSKIESPAKSSKNQKKNTEKLLEATKETIQKRAQQMLKKNSHQYNDVKRYNKQTEEQQIKR